MDGDQRLLSQVIDETGTVDTVPFLDSDNKSITN